MTNSVETQNKPKVTVVTVTYNAAQHLETTIKSVIEQDYGNLEYIIIDGGSTDNTADIVRKYSQYIDFWLSGPDNGIFDAMNKGAEKASGDWINFMNAGDSFCDQRIVSKVISSLEPTTDIISGGINYHEGSGKRYREPKGQARKFNGMFCFHQTMFVKTALMKKLGFDTTFRIAADYDFTLKCAIGNYNFQYLDIPIANYLAGGTSEKRNILARIEDLFIQSRYLEDPREIYALGSYNLLKSYDPNQGNYMFAYLFNHLYKWLNSLDKTKKYVLYGFGHIGRLIRSEGELNIVGIVDQNYRRLSEATVIAVHDIAQIDKFDFDYVIITALGREKEITEFLSSKNVATESILTVNLN